MKFQTFARVVLLGLLSTAAHAEGIKYDCDTSPGHFSELNLPAGQVPFTVTGTLQPLNPAKDKKYVPMARLAVSSASEAAGPSKEGWAGFGYLVVPEKVGKKATIPVLEFSSMIKGGKKNDEIIARPSAVQISFKITYDGEKAAIEIDGHSRQIEIVAEEPMVQIVCSTGEFLFTDLQIRSGS